MRFIKTLTILFCILCLQSAAKAENLFSVTFVCCCSSSGFFWPKVESFMDAVADELRIDLEVIYADMNHIRMKEIALEVTNRENPPDYLIIDNYKLMAGSILQAIEPTGIKVFLMANGLTRAQQKKYGKPREKYKNWIGELTPNNYFIGLKTAEALIQKSTEKEKITAGGEFNLIALSGDNKTPAGVQRVNGLLKAVENSSGVVLQQIVPCHWDQDEAKRKIAMILERYPQTNMVWSANDEMALGAMEGAKALGRIPGKDIFFVGVNWKKEALQKIVDNTMLASGGGHFMIGGWSLVLLYDYHNGRDFEEEGVQLKMKIFEVLDKNNVSPYLTRYGAENWAGVNFTLYSKVLNPDLTKYEFSPERFLSEAD